MFFSGSQSLGGSFVAALLVLQATFTSAAPLSESSLEKRITCQLTQVPINNACVNCADLYTNATRCTRSVPTFCSYGVVINRKCQAVNCTSGYLNDNGKQCVACAENAATCNSNGTLTCNPGYILSNGTCQDVNNAYAEYTGYTFNLGLDVSGSTGPYAATAGAESCVDDNTSRTFKYTGVSATTSPDSCFSQEGSVSQNLVKTTDRTAAIILKGTCDSYIRNNFVRVNGAHHFCNTVFITAPTVL